MLSVSQLRQVFAKLLLRPRPSAKQIAEQINRVLRRNEEARIYSWLQRANRFPPARGGANDLPDIDSIHIADPQMMQIC